MYLYYHCTFVYYFFYVLHNTKGLNLKWIFEGMQNLYYFTAIIMTIRTMRNLSLKTHQRFPTSICIKLSRIVLFSAKIEITRDRLLQDQVCTCRELPESMFGWTVGRPTVHPVLMLLLVPLF